VCVVQLKGSWRLTHADYGAVGTFARVWLVKLANPSPEDKDKVFALKVLRKVEGRSYTCRSFIHVLITWQ
jgi:hypothetical protein